MKEHMNSCLLQIIQFYEYKAGLLLLTKTIKKDYLQK